MAFRRPKLRTRTEPTEAVRMCLTELPPAPILPKKKKEKKPRRVPPLLLTDSVQTECCLHFTCWDRRIPLLLLFLPSRACIGVYMFNPDYFHPRKSPNLSDLQRVNWTHRTASYDPDSWPGRVQFGRVRNAKALLGKFRPVPISDEVRHEEPAFREFDIDLKWYHKRVKEVQDMADYPAINATLCSESFSIYALENTYLHYVLQRLRPSKGLPPTNPQILSVALQGSW
jgi:hypothetical protein